jgi:anti-anti-sigma factor
MEAKASRQGEVAILDLSGPIDTRATRDFEREVLALVKDGARHIVLDFARVDIITSAGIRVLVMLGKRLKALEGGFVLAGVTEQVKTVFDIAGLTAQLRMAASQQDAVALLAASSSGVAAHQSAVSRLAMRLLGGNEPSKRRGAGKAAAGASPLSSHLARLLDAERSRTSPESPSESKTPASEPCQD